jgi:hypothetical protein
MKAKKEISFQRLGSNSSDDSGTNPCAPLSMNSLMRSMVGFLGRLPVQKLTANQTYLITLVTLLLVFAALVLHSDFGPASPFVRGVVVLFFFAFGFAALALRTR